MYQQFLNDGAAASLILALVIVEAGCLVWRARSPKGTPFSVWASPMLAGAALVMALLLTQLHAPAEAVGVSLILAGIAHAAGFRQRWINDRS
ncbi:MAG: hypothetical protein AAF671_01550 [Pseudomonadota bacterium]